METKQTTGTSKIKLPAVCWQMIVDLLQMPGWAMTPKHIFIAGKMDAEGVINIPSQPIPANKEAETKWMGTEVENTLTENQIEVVKACLQAFVGKGAIGGNKWSRLALLAFLPNEQ